MSESSSYLSKWIWFNFQIMHIFSVHQGYGLLLLKFLMATFRCASSVFDISLPPYCSIFGNQSFEQHSQGLQVCLINLNHVVCVSCLSCSIGLSAFIPHHKMIAAIYRILFPVTVSWLDVLSDCRRSSLGWTWALVNYVKRSKSIKSLLVRRFVRWIFSCEDALQTTQLS
jgi:hypothetical protein